MREMKKERETQRMRERERETLILDFEDEVLLEM